MNSNQKTRTIVDVIVKKYEDGKYAWAIPSLGYCDSYSLSEVKDFMKRHKLSFRVRRATRNEERLEELEN